MSTKFLKKEKSVVSIPLKIHKDGAIYPGQPFRWNQEESRYEVKITRMSKYFVHIMLTFFFISTNAVMEFARSQNVVKMAYACTLCGHCFGAGVVFNTLIKNAEEAAAFMNGCRTIEEFFKRKGIKLTGSKTGILVMQGFRFSARLISLVYSIGSYLIPCFPVNFFAPLLSQCKAPEINSQGSPWWLEVEISSALSSTFYFGLFNVGFAGVSQILLGFLFQLSALNGIQKCLDSRRKYETILAYRQLQLLKSLFNKSHSGVLLAPLVALAAAEECWAYLVIRAPSSEVPALFRVVVLGLLLETIWMTLVLYGYAGTIHTNSKRILANGRSNLVIFTNPELKRTLRSCPPLKISFGGSNYFDKATNVKCFEFSVLRFVDLLIMERQWKMKS